MDKWQLWVWQCHVEETQQSFCGDFVRHSRCTVGFLLYYTGLGHNWADILHNEPTAGGYWFGVMLIHHWMISISIFKR